MARAKSAHLLLGGYPENVRAARWFLREQATSWGFRRLAEDIVFVGSELVTNAVVHARSDVLLDLMFDGKDCVRVEVHDDDSRMPSTTPPDPEALGGRGLVVIGQLASQWGVEREPHGGKCVWAEFTPV